MQRRGTGVRLSVNYVTGRESSTYKTVSAVASPAGMWQEQPQQRGADSPNDEIISRRSKVRSALTSTGAPPDTDRKLDRQRGTTLHSNPIANSANCC